MILDEQTRLRVAAATRFSDIRELADVDSTNRYLLDLARAGAPEGVVVVADHQWAGRGRRGRTWEAPPGGGLLVSILLRPGRREQTPFLTQMDRDGSSVAGNERTRTRALEAGLAPSRGWLVPAAVALAAADACGPEVAIKWPNDLLLGGRKLAGILAEADAGAVVVGIGINVAAAPPGAVALGPTIDRGELLATLLVNLEGWCERWDDVETAYRARCATIGQEVRVEQPGETLVGRAEDVGPDGRLRVVTSDGARFFSAADVIHLRPARNVTDP